MTGLDAVGVTFLGMMMATHPCPLTLNLSALSIICGSQKAQRCRILATGLFCASGYVAAYFVLGWLLSLGIASNARIARGLGDITGPLVGPVLILVGMFRCGLLSYSTKVDFLRRLPERIRQRNWNLVGVALLGGVLALTFCPATAAVFFGSVVANIDAESRLLYPALFALGAAIPVVACAYFVSRGVHVLEGIRGRRLRGRLAVITGGLLIGLGVYYSVVNNFMWERVLL